MRECERTAGLKDEKNELNIHIYIYIYVYVVLKVNIDLRYVGGAVAREHSSRSLVFLAGRLALFVS